MQHIPCPARIPSDLGDAFATGAVLGSMFYMCKGAYHSVRRERFIGGLRLVRSRAPILGGSFALWGGIFATSSCVFKHIRGHEDALNSIASGFVTGFTLSIRTGLRGGLRNGLFGGIFLGVIEGVMIFMNMYQKRNELKEKIEEGETFRREMERSFGNRGKSQSGEKVQVDKSNNL